MSEWSVGLEVSELSSSEVEVSFSASHWFFPFFLLGGPPFFLASPLWPEEEVAGFEVDVALTECDGPLDDLGLAACLCPPLRCIPVRPCWYCERLTNGKRCNLW